MRILLIAAFYPPVRISGATQMHDLALKFVEQGHAVSVLVPSDTISSKVIRTNIDGIDVIQIRARPTRDINYVKRTINEFLMPYTMLRAIKSNSIDCAQWEGIAWYSPSIFFGPLIKFIKKKSRCRTYLILRDIFPEWAIDLGIMKRGPHYYYFKAVQAFQYSMADTIGVQSAGNLGYFETSIKKGKSVEVLNNWLNVPENTPCTIDISKTTLAGRKVFIYAGNMGYAQNLTSVLDLAERLIVRKDIGFLFIGRGDALDSLKQEAQVRSLTNILFLDSIKPSEIPNLYAQCCAGLVYLDVRHNSHNIPGKFISYLQAGLPVLAQVNAGNDMEQIIQQYKVGKVSSQNSADKMQKLLEELTLEIKNDLGFSKRCQQLWASQFSTDTVAEQISHSLFGHGKRN